jgi:hypothetical protein
MALALDTKQSQSIAILAMYRAIFLKRIQFHTPINNAVNLAIVLIIIFTAFIAKELK